MVAACRRDPHGGGAGGARAGRRPGAVAGDFALALGAGLEKLSVQMTVDQRRAIALFESLGFKAEALLRDHVRDVDGKKHDIVVLGHNVAQVRAQMEAYGLPGRSPALMRLPAGPSRFTGKSHKSDADHEFVISRSQH